MVFTGVKIGLSASVPQPSPKGYPVMEERAACATISLHFHKVDHVSIGFLLWEIRAAFLGESQPRQSSAIKPTVHARWFSVSLIHRI